MMRFGAAALIAAAAVAFSAPAEARVLDHFQIKVGVSGILPDESGDPIPAEISDEYVPSLQVEYFFNNHVSAELLCCVATHDVTAANGAVDLGQVTHFPPTVMSLTPSLDRAAAENSVCCAQGGPLIPEPIISSIGHLLPIELCGRSSL